MRIINALWIQIRNINVTTCIEIDKIKKFFTDYCGAKNVKLQLVKNIDSLNNEFPSSYFKHFKVDNKNNDIDTSFNLSDIMNNSERVKSVIMTYVLYVNQQEVLKVIIPSVITTTASVEDSIQLGQEIDVFNLLISNNDDYDDNEDEIKNLSKTIDFSHDNKNIMNEENVILTKILNCSKDLTPAISNNDDYDDNEDEIKNLSKTIDFSHDNKNILNEENVILTKILNCSKDLTPAICKQAVHSVVLYGIIIQKMFKVASSCLIKIEDFYDSYITKLIKEDLKDKSFVQYFKEISKLIFFSNLLNIINT
jgi:hypothetical protein